ncbi:MAG: hypothetical protein R3A50_14135 [Saprospiraceae bacterium]|nr:hypothetical protein [Saprospiraceae bacterium]MCB9343064.1 hypothetical protein [Lewinellaceae bacterium]
MNNRDSLLGIIGTIYRWRKVIRNVTLVALIGSVGFALWLPNYYKSTTIFYPTSQELAKPEIIFGASGKVQDYFGTDRDLDRLMEVASSNEVVDFIVQKFNLYQHYGIDSASSEGLFWVRETFRGVYVVQKNKNDALELSVEDTDRQLASDMANAARDKINEVAQRMLKKNQESLMLSFEENISNKLQNLNVLADSLRYLQNRYGIYSVLEQGDRLTNDLADAESEVLRNRARLQVLDHNPLIPRDTIEYIKANLKAYESTLKKLQSPNQQGDNFSVRNFNEGLPQVMLITDLHFQARKQLSFDLERYNQVKAAYNTDIPGLQVLSYAEPAIMKNRPKRSMIVIASVIAAFLFTLFAALLADAYRDINWKETLSDK